MSDSPLLQTISALFRRAAGRVDPITRAWGTITGGNLVRMALGLVSSVLIARALGPALFGVYATLGAVANIAGAVADFGLSSTAVKRIAVVWSDAPDEAARRGQTFFWLRLGLASLVVGPAVLLADPLSRLILGEAGRTAVFQLALFGVLATALSGATSSLLQATSRFRYITALTLTNAGLTVGFALFLVAIDRLTLVTALLILGIATSCATFVVGRRLLPPELSLSLPAWPHLRVESRSLLRFGRWLGVANVLAMSAAYLDIVLVNRWSVPVAVGAYALALNLANRVDVVNQSLFTVLLPEAAALDDDSIGRYTRRELLRSILIALALLPLFALIRPFVLILYGSAYAPAIDLFRLLLVVVIFDVLTTPLLLLAFPFEHPKALAAAEAARLVTLVAGAVVLVPRMGPAGAAIAKLTAHIVGAVLMYLLLRTALHVRRS